MHHTLTFIAMVSLAFNSLCLGQCGESRSAHQDVSTADVKKLVGRILDLCHRTGAASEESNVAVVCAFQIDPDGSIPASSLKILHSVGDKSAEKILQQFLAAIGQAHALAPLAVLSLDTLDLKVDDKGIHFSLAGFAPTQADAKSKASQLKFIFGLLKWRQEGKSRAAMDFWGRIVVSADDKRVSADVTIPCGLADELWKELDR